MGIPTLILATTADDDATISFTSGIDGTYDEYMFVFTDINLSTDGETWRFQVNATDGADYNDSLLMSTYWFSAHREDDGGTPEFTQSSAYDRANIVNPVYIIHNQGNGSDESFSGVMHLFSPASTTYVKHFYSRMHGYGHIDQAGDFFVAGYINDTTAIDNIQFSSDAGNFDGVIQMYGIA